MRLAIWSEFFHPYIGGVERSAAILFPELHKRGFELIIVTSHHYLSLPNEELWHGIPLYRFDFSTALANQDLATVLRQQKRLAAIMESFKPEVHHIFGMGPSMLACVQILKRQSAPFIVSIVNMEQSPERAYASGGVIAKTLTSAAWVTTVSQAILEQTVHYLPATKSHISVLYSGYPTPTVAPTPLATPPRLLLLGRLVVEKGGALALTAFQKIYQRYPDLRLVIAGDGPERAPWQEMAREFGERVEFTGWVAPEEVYALYNSVTIVLIPSRWEGLPIVAIESAFMARPTVATRIAGMAEIIIDGKTGILVEPEDAEGLANAIAHLLDHPDQAVAMGLAAKEKVEQFFTQKRLVEEHEALYQRIVEMA